MAAIAPNLTALLGEIVSARFLPIIPHLHIAHFKFTKIMWLM